MNIVAELTTKALRPHGGDAWSRYREGLSVACKKSPPPFGTKNYGDIYREAATDPYWLATSLISNAEREGDGAGRLWDLAACTPAADIAGQVRQHAIDESRHSRAYVAMLDLAFPGAVDETFHLELTTLSPGYTHQSPQQAHDGSPFAQAISVDDLIQMNIAEIRTLIHHKLQRPMILAHCASERHVRLVRILDGLLADETRHIAYTAALIDQFARNGETGRVMGLMQERVSDFNAITSEELGRNVFESV